MKNDPPRAAETLPIKQVLEEFGFLRRTFREIVSHYAAEVESDIAQLAAMVGDQGDLKKAPRGRVHDLRDMLMALQALEVRPDKGRRRDLKKVESLLEELRAIAGRW